jgi:hypothetical protein
MTILDGTLVRYEMEIGTDCAGGFAEIDTPGCSVAGDTDGSMVLQLFDAHHTYIELQPDDLAILERVVSSGILRRLVELAREEFARRQVSA